MTDHPRISNCLWFATEAEEAVRFWCDIVPGSGIHEVTRYVGGAVPPVEGLRAGMVMTLRFTLAGQPFLALNGGLPVARTLAHSIVVSCRGQAELDRIWEGLLQGGGAELECGWLVDRYGLNWQVVPDRFDEWLVGPPEARAQMVQALWGMRRIDIAALEAAYRG